ncbi:hypothetical protein [Kitasatospora sp. LaBMicrA B282]|uniref:hypothetical protein n=1 Tax=Kitasatospora sp. LaBMicrA B282 TaxID=3420949 RepID=UPI003D0DB2C4
MPKPVRETRQKQRQKAADERKAELEMAEVESAPTEKFVPIGLDYARWVNERLLSGPWPVPSHGFHLGDVAASCDQARRLAWQRRVCLVLAVAAGAAWAWTLDPRWAPAVVLVGMWLSFYRDRVMAQRLLREAMDVDQPAWPQRPATPPAPAPRVQRIQGLEGQPVIPYQTEPRTGRVRYHFLGAGHVWYEQTIGIDVMARLPRQQQDVDDNSANELRTLLPSIDRLVSGRDDDGGVKPFTPDDVIDHLARELQRPIRPDRDFHPDSRQDVFAIATLNANRWPDLSPDQWKALVTLAHDGVRAPGAHKAPKTARRFLCARMVSWDGELVASVFIGVAYENHFLRVVVRPQILNPVHPTITAARGQVRERGWAFHRMALWQSLIDVKTAVKHALIGGPPARERRPALDAGQPIVSLREIYSARYMDDMLQYDDARRYISMMEGRVFAAAEGFLVDHNIDTTSFREQITVILNNGIINSGGMTNVQNQLQAVNSQQVGGGT